MEELAIVSFLDTDGAPRQVPLSSAAGLPFHDYPPVRVPAAYRGQGHWPGFYWFATTRSLISYESRLELSWLLFFDFDMDVKAVSAQPFRLNFLRVTPKRSHVPDFFVRLANGRERVVDVKPAHRVVGPTVQVAFTATREACGVAGWDYQVLTEPDPVLLANVRWLAGFRRRARDADLTKRVLNGCHCPISIGEVSLRCFAGTRFGLCSFTSYGSARSQPISRSRSPMPAS